MAENEVLWYLCNSRTRFESGAVNLAKAKEICSQIIEADAALWHIWQAGWSAWKPLPEVTELYSFIKRPPVLPPPIPVAPPPIPMMPPPIPAAPKAVETILIKHTAPVGVQMTTPRPIAILQPIPTQAETKAASQPPPTQSTAKDESNRRKFERYAVRLRVIIRNEQLTFRTFSRNISLGGICLEHPLPPHLFNQKCQIFIAGPNQKANLRLRLAPTSRNDLRYFSFAGLEEQSLNELKRWLESSVKKPVARPA